MDFEIRTPTEAAADFKRSLNRFLDSHSFDNDEGFTMHWSEPHGAEVIHHVTFETVAVAEAFRSTWRGSEFDRE